MTGPLAALSPHQHMTAVPFVPSSRPLPFRNMSPHRRDAESAERASSYTFPDHQLSSQPQSHSAVHFHPSRSSSALRDGPEAPAGMSCGIATPRQAGGGPDDPKEHLDRSSGSDPTRSRSPKPKLTLALPVGAGSGGGAARPYYSPTADAVTHDADAGAAARVDFARTGSSEAGLRSAGLAAASDGSPVSPQTQNTTPALYSGNSTTMKAPYLANLNPYMPLPMRSAPMATSHQQYPPASSVMLPPLRQVQSSPHLTHFSSGSSSSTLPTSLPFGASSSISSMRSTANSAEALRPISPAPPNPSSEPTLRPLGPLQQPAASSSSSTFPARPVGSVAAETPIPSALAPFMAKRHSLGSILINGELSRNPALSSPGRGQKRKMSLADSVAQHVASMPSPYVAAEARSSGEAVPRRAGNGSRSARFAAHPRIQETDEAAEDDPDAMVIVKEEPTSPGPTGAAASTSSSPHDGTDPSLRAKRRRVTIAEGSHIPDPSGAVADNAEASTTDGRPNAEPLSPLVLGFTHRADTMAQQQLAAAKKVREDQERLIQQRRNGASKPASAAVETSIVQKGKGRPSAKSVSASKAPGEVLIAATTPVSQAMPEGDSTPAAPAGTSASTSGLANRRGVAEKVRPLALTGGSSGSVGSEAKTGQGAPTEGGMHSAPLGGRFFQSTNAGEPVKTPQIARYGLQQVAASGSGGVTPGLNTASAVATSVAAPGSVAATGSGPMLAVPTLPALPPFLGQQSKAAKGPAISSSSQPGSALPRVPEGTVSQAPQASAAQAAPPRFAFPFQQQQQSQSQPAPYRFGAAQPMLSPTHPAPPPPAPPYAGPSRSNPINRRMSFAALNFGGAGQPLPSRDAFLQPFEVLYDCLSDALTLKVAFEDNVKRSADHLAIMQKSSQTVERMVDDKIQNVVDSHTRELQLLERRIDRLESAAEADRGQPLPPLKKARVDGTDVDRRGSGSSRGSKGNECVQDDSQQGGPRSGAPNEQSMKALLARLDRLERTLERKS